MGANGGGPTTYNASKAAMISFSKTVARQLAKDHILVNTVAPGSILFPGGLGAPPAAKPGADRAVSRDRFSLRPLWASLKRWRRSWSFWPLRQASLITGGLH